MPVCDAYIREGALPPSLGGRAVAPPGIAARLTGYAGCRRGGQRLAGPRRERARVLAEPALGMASA